MQMNDISYEILDLFKKYGADKEGILKILEADSRPEVLYALSDIRRNLMDWMDFSGQENVLQLGSDYGVITGLLAERCDHVAVVDERDENHLELPWLKTHKGTWKMQNRSKQTLMPWIPAFYPKTSCLPIPFFLPPLIPFCPLMD